jgi:PAS domain S-box-containing protein
VTTNPHDSADRKDAADRLRRLRDEILRQWQDRVRSEVPAAKWHSPGVILDSIPKLLDQLAAALESGSAPSTDPPPAAQEHADQRAALANYSLDQVVYEYHLLRRVILNVLQLESPLPRVGRIAVHDGIDAAVQLATDEYVREKQAELHKQTARLEEQAHVMDLAPVLIRDLDGRIRLWTKGASRLYGWSKEEAEGKISHELLQATFPRPLEEINAELTQKGNWEGELVHRCKDGSSLVVASHWALHRGDEGKPVHVLEANNDITEAYHLREQLRQRAEELAVANRAREEFLAMLSHELRNPLAPILNAVHVMRMIRLENPILQQSLSMIERQMRQMGRLVDDLLDMARLTRGKVHLRKEPVEMSVLVDRSVETIRTLAQERRHQVTLNLPNDPVWIDADPVRAEQILVNLLTNAVKYSEPGGQIWATVQREGDQAIVRVKDTGVGITPDLLPRVFDLFSQVERPIDRSQGGLGLGLAVSRMLVEMHGGTVEAHSEGPGKGSEFIVRLPMGSGPGAAVPELPATPRQGQAMRLLVVDDNVDAADSLALFLRLYGHEVRTAHNGPDALKQAAAFRPAVVFLDIGLPGMDGYEVARRLRAAGAPRCLLVALTGYGHEADREKSRAAGFDYHLVKPADPASVEELLRVMKEDP